MTDEERAKRIAELRAEFQRLIEFHEVSFRDIDAKAKYWLTITLPTFVALVGYIYEAGQGMGLSLQLTSYALAGGLFVSTFLLSSVVRTRAVESGILKPPSHSFADVKYFLESEDHWRELGEDQTAELLRAIGNNERQNAVKSLWLRRGELSLLRGVPTSICLAAGSAFLYAAACPDGLLTASGVGTSRPSAGRVAAAGIVIGVGTAAAFVFADHFITRYRSRSK